ncbi:hypothetical protein [uncultured Vibrio sp.]|uniref:hypothetical protein n=1 Tax=uncultured Vibrio sp. TaxID=114054 RepID=UPI002AAAE31D|nr:hypothetical protein [uncultured Vibrio sp.]
MSNSVTAERATGFELASLTEGLLSDIVSQLANESDISQDTLSRLQVNYPDLRFTLCFEEEMGSHDAYVEASGFDVHLVSHSSSGCSSLTQDLAQSSGLVIALHDE